MTRWAKAGHSQKHQKMPEDPTPWEELAANIKKLNKKSLKKEPFKQQSIKVKDTENSEGQKTITSVPSVEENKVSPQKSRNTDRVSSKKLIKKFKSETKKKQKIELSAEILDQNVDTHVNENNIQEIDLNSCSSRKIENSQNNEVVKNTSTKRHVKQQKFEKKKNTQSNVELADQFIDKTENEFNSLENENSFSISKDGNQVDAKNELLSDKPLSKRQIKKIKRENKKKLNTANVEYSNQNTNENDDNADDSKHDQLLPEKKKLNKKKLFMQRLQKKRAENGITLLSPKIERKLYMIKKRLREKGFTPEMIKDIIRKERRKAELDTRKPVINKTCFNCRQVGHVLADCPIPPTSNDSNHKTGICFKCGSAEHSSFKCTKEVSGYPFATCFICKKTGHISRECPDNKHGVYIRGGKCNLCGNINHFRKDCPTLIKKEKEEVPAAAVHTIFEGASIDDEITDFKGVPPKKKKIQKNKIVKF